jgi:hypothetical protein
MLPSPEALTACQLCLSPTAAALKTQSLPTLSVITCPYTRQHALMVHQLQTFCAAVWVYGPTAAATQQHTTGTSKPTATT